MTSSLGRLPLFVCLGLLMASISSVAQDIEDESWQWEERSFVIAASTTSYEGALEAAQEVSSTLDIRLDLRDLSPDPDNGLSFPASECEANGWEHPCYVARGRYDNGVYVSIEHTDAYEGFAKGYYIVVIASGAEDAGDLLKAALKKARKEYADAYMKKTKVFVGCMH